MVTHSSRRRLLTWLLSTSGGALLAVLAYPIVRFVVPPAESEEATGAVSAGALKDFPPNSGKVVRFGARPAIVVRTPGGEVRAFSAACTHLQCTVQYRPDLERIWCACHNGQFDLEGRNVGGPPPRPLEVLRVDVRGADVILSRGG